MRAKPSSSRSSKSTRSNKKSHGGSSKSLKKGKESDKKTGPDLSVLRQPVDTSIHGLKQAVKVFETGTPEVVHLLTYDCDVIYECKVCRNLFRSIANFISHKRIYCTLRYSQSTDLQRSNKQEEECKIVLGEKIPERLPTRITARKDLTSIVETLANQRPSSQLFNNSEDVSGSNGERKQTTVHLEPMENTAFGVFQTVLKSDSQNLMRNQVAELQSLLAKNEVVLGPDGRVLQNGLSDLHQEDNEAETADEGVTCNICDAKLSSRKVMLRHKKLLHETVKMTFVCPVCKQYFSSIWSVLRHLYRVHRKTTEQIRRLRSQIARKEIRVETPAPSNTESNKKSPSPSKKRVVETINQSKLYQDNKEWMDHFEGDGEFQRCGGCGRNFDRKVALISHLKICQKRIAVCNRIEQSHHMPNMENALVPVAEISPLSVSKKPIPRPSTEKKIGIQVRMNYCKGSPSQVVCRQRSTSHSVHSVGDESDIEALSVDSKETFFTQDKNSPQGSVLEQFLKNTNSCRSTDGVEKVNSYLNNTKHGLEGVQTYEISTCKRSTVLRSNVGKNKNLEAKCLQLRSALENGLKDSTKKEHDVVFLDSNLDNTSESNTSAISSLSSQLTPLVDKGFVGEVEQSIEIKTINISRSPEIHTPRTEADSTSNGSLQMTCRTYKENIKFSPAKEASCEEVSTSVISDDLPHSETIVEMNGIHDDEISVDMKPNGEAKSPNSEFENTISILTRNQLKAICQDDQPIKSEENIGLEPQDKFNNSEIEEKTKLILRKRFKKFADEEKLMCTLCKKKFNTASWLYRHIPLHSKWKRYECLFDGCAFQSFSLPSIQGHVPSHSFDKKQPNLSLIGIIDSRKWNLKLLDQPTGKNKIQVKPKKVIVTKKSIKVTQQLNKSEKANVSRNNKPKIKIAVNSSRLKNKSVVKSKIISKQKLLTDFSSFHKASTDGKKVESKTVTKTLSNRPMTKSGFVPRSKRKFLIMSEEEKGAPPKLKKSNDTDKNDARASRSKSSSVETEILDSTLSSISAKSPTKQQKQSPVNSSDTSKGKLIVVKKEAKEEIIVNHIAEENSEPTVTRVRSSRTSSRKSSVNSVDQQKAKSCSPVVKVEDKTPQLPSEPQSSIYIQNSTTLDGSLEEEESQEESDKPVDDSQLQKIYMEVIFGPSTTDQVAPTSTRPIRNKVRPKKMNDCVLNNLKDEEKEAAEGKIAVSKKTKSPVDLKVLPDVPKKSK